MHHGWNENYRRTHVDIDGSLVVVIGRRWMTLWRPVSGPSSFVKGACRYFTADGRSVEPDEAGSLRLSKGKTPLPLHNH